MQGPDFWLGRKSVNVTDAEWKAPIQLPGPADTWAGGESKEIHLFPPLERSVEYTIEIMDSHRTIPPSLEIISNGRVIVWRYCG